MAGAAVLPAGPGGANLGGKEADPDDQTAITWTDPNYPHQLNRYTALHYFEMSPFFDAASNNTLARQQGRDPGVMGALEFVAPAGGIEYAVDVEQPPHLFVIRKQLRKGPDTAIPGAVTLLAFYYILDRVIYQAPSLHAVLSSRIRRCVWALHQGFDKLQVDLDPLVKLCKEQQQKEQQQDQQNEPLPENGSAKLSNGACPKVRPSDVAPLPMVRRVPPDEAAYWKRTDNIILTVLNRYPIPELPDVYYQAQAAQAAQQPQPPSVEPPTDAPQGVGGTQAAETGAAGRGGVVGQGAGKQQGAAAGGAEATGGGRSAAAGGTSGSGDGPPPGKRARR